MPEKERNNRQVVPKTVAKLALGILLVLLGGILVSIWKWQLQVVLKGSAGIALILIGAVIIAICKD